MYEEGGEQNWSVVSKRLSDEGFLRKSAKQCRERYFIFKVDTKTTSVEKQSELSGHHKNSKSWCSYTIKWATSGL